MFNKSLAIIKRVFSGCISYPPCHVVCCGKADIPPTGQSPSIRNLHSISDITAPLTSLPPKAETIMHCISPDKCFICM